MTKFVLQAESTRRRWTKPKMRRLKSGDAEFNVAVGPDAETETS